MSNHIDHIEIKNFKSIRHQTIDGCKRINVFIGYPNVGKSAILEAISTLSYLKKDFTEPLDKLCRLKTTNELFFDGAIKNNINISFTKDFQFILEYSSVDILNYYVAIKKFVSIDNHPIKDTITYSPVKTIQFRNGIFELIQDNFNIEQKITIKKYTFQNSFNEFMTNGLVLSSPFGENLVDIVQFNKELRKEVGQLFKFYNLRLLIDQATNSIRGMKQLDEETVFTVPFYQMADTLQRLIFHKAAIMSNENTVLLFEEPEAHMFPPYISQFTSDVIYNKENNNQYFISTHSPFVMNDFLEDARDELSVFLVGLKNGETIIKRLSDEEMHKIYQHGVDLFFNIESYLD